MASTAAVVSNGVASRPTGGVLGSGLVGGGEGSKPNHHHHTRMRAAVQGLEEAEDSDQEDIEVVNFNDGKKNLVKDSIGAQSVNAFHLIFWTGVAQSMHFKRSNMLQGEE